MAEIIPVTKDQLFEMKIAENMGSDYNVGDISNVVPVTKDQALLKEIALNSAGQSGDISELEEKVSATQDMLSGAYDSTHTYNVGDYCIYENALYKCNTANTTGSWDSSKWDAVTVAEELGELTEKTTNHSVTIEPISPNDLQGSTLSVVNGVLVGSVCFFRTDSTDYLLRQWVTVAHTSLRLSRPIQTSLYSETEGLSGGLMNIGTNGDIMVFQNYYDPTGTATKRGASGMFSTPI